MRRIAGCCRFVFNQALAIQKERNDQGKAELDFAGLALLLAGWRRQPVSIWLADVPFGCLQQALRNLERAYARYHSAQTRFPVFKKSGRSDSFRYSNNSEFKLDQTNSRLFFRSLAGCDIATAARSWGG